FVTGSFSLVAEDLNFQDPNNYCLSTVTANQFVCRQLGSQTTTGFRTSVFRDTRDYYLDPRTGWRIGGGFDYGTPYLGGTNNFYKYYIDAIKYTPLPYDTRFSLHVRYGDAEGIKDKPVPLTELFFVGGINTMRGFVFGRAGPVDPNTYALLGANKQLIFNNDFIFTISSEAKLNGVIFFDYGKGFAQDESVTLNLRKAAGIEGRWISPFGPLRVAYGINLEPRTGERKGVFEFTMGQMF
ncbi:MAG TPA: BamA/TamA family outer membrane protein, partial [Nitrospiraceae bacterium]